MDSRAYRVGGSSIALHFGDLTTSEAEALVSSDDFMLSMGGGVSRALRRAGGSRVAAEAAKMAPAQLGDVVVTSAGDLPARYILHAITIGEQAVDLAPDAIIRQAVPKVMALLPLLGCGSVAFPAIGTGAAGLPSDVVASEMAAALVSALLNTTPAYQVELYLMDRRDLRFRKEDFFTLFERVIAQTLGMQTTRAGDDYALAPPALGDTSPNSEEVRDAERRHQVFTMLRHLRGRRNQLEGALVAALTGVAQEHDDSLAGLRAQLVDVQELIRSYESQMAQTNPKPMTPIARSVFLSSTAADLRPERHALRELISRLHLSFIGMEEFHPTAEAPALLIRRMVETAEIYLGVLGMRYGSIDAGSGLSMTELEYRQAIASRKEVCMFVMDTAARITVGMVEQDPQGFAKLIDFRSRVLNSHTCAMFVDIADLVEKAEHTLRQFVLPPDA